MKLHSAALWLGLALPTTLAAQPRDPAEQLGLGPATASVRRGDVVYSALAGGGVAVIDLGDPAAPRLITRLAEGRAVSRLVLDGDRLLVLVLSEQALSYAITDAAAPVPLLTGSAAEAAVVPLVEALPQASSAPAPAEPAMEAPDLPSPLARVIDVTGGRVLFDGGREEGFRKGARVRVIAQRLVSKPDLEKGGSIKVPSGEVTAVVEIEEVQAHRAMAQLGRGDVALIGDLVEPTGEPLSESVWLPRRAPIRGRAGFHARPFLGITTPERKPVGMLLDLYGSYYFEILPVAVSLEASPAGFVLFSSDLHYPATLTAVVSYYTDYFEIGIGAGALIGNRGPCYYSGPVKVVSPDKAAGTFDRGELVCEENNGPTVNQMLRLGALDGIHLTWNSSIFSRPDAFVFGVGRAELGVPVSSRLGLFAAGGAGENGWNFGELGMRSFFGGTGAPGTFMLSASLGWVGIFDGAGEAPDYQAENVSGPAVAIGGEWRL